MRSLPAGYFDQSSEGGGVAAVAVPATATNAAHETRTPAVARIT
jgi:hypothetical protein